MTVISSNLDAVTVTLYDKCKESTAMKNDDIVKFKHGLFSDEAGTRYKVIEVNGDRVIIEFICDLIIPPQSIANVNELEVTQA